jgi:flagellar biogenesis protein FliO
MRNDAVAQRVVPIAGAHSRLGRRLYLQVYRGLRQLLRLGERPQRRLRLSESLALGERRFVAVVEFERQRFLLGGTGQSLVLLAKLDETCDYEPKSTQEELR